MTNRIEALRIFLDTEDCFSALEHAGTIVNAIGIPVSELKLRPYWKLREQHELELRYQWFGLETKALSLFPSGWLRFEDGSMVNANPISAKLSLVKWISYTSFDEAANVYLTVPAERKGI